MTEDIISNKNKKLSYNRGLNHPNWKGGRITTTWGYIMIYMPEHPRAVKNYVREHIVIMEQYLGRYLREGEVVHHINKIKTDNRIENLQLFASNSEHLSMENQIDMSNRICSDCGSNKTCMSRGKRPFWRLAGGRIRCNSCYRRWRRHSRLK